MAVHVDDLIMVAPPRELEKLVTELRRNFELKVEKLQPGGRISYLKRTVAWTDGGIEWSPNKVHLEKLRLAMKLDGPRVNGPMTPMDKEVYREIPDRPLMARDDAKQYRSLAARINYLAQDRPDLSLAACLLTSNMATPSEGR